MRPAGKLGVSGALAGLACGLFGGGGGMVLAPLLTRWCHVEEKRVFANCVAVIFPLCALSAGVFLLRTGLDFGQALPYLAGGLVGGRLFKKVLGLWLRRIFALFLLYGGWRYLFTGG